MMCLCVVSENDNLYTRLRIVGGQDVRICVISKEGEKPCISGRLLTILFLNSEEKMGKGGGVLTFCQRDLRFWWGGNCDSIEIR